MLRPLKNIVQNSLGRRSERAQDATTGKRVDMSGLNAGQREALHIPGCSESNSPSVLASIGFGTQFIQFIQQYHPAHLVCVAILLEFSLHSTNCLRGENSLVKDSLGNDHTHTHTYIYTCVYNQKHTSYTHAHTQATYTIATAKSETNKTTHPPTGMYKSMHMDMEHTT